MTAKKTPIATCPFTILVDTREQRPYTFCDIFTDKKDGRRPIEISTVRIMLGSGDYAVTSSVEMAAVERKSLEDFCGTLTAGRDRFERELARLNALSMAWVVVEADFASLLRGELGRSEVCPKTLWRSVMAWQVRFKRVHWWFCPGRAAGEAVTFRLLERWWKEQNSTSRDET
jgi:DNA excision repair protein ERCC-4